QEIVITPPEATERIPIVHPRMSIEEKERLRRMEAARLRRLEQEERTRREREQERLRHQKLAEEMEKDTSDTSDVELRQPLNLYERENLARLKSYRRMSLNLSVNRSNRADLKGL